MRLVDVEADDQQGVCLLNGSCGPDELIGRGSGDWLDHRPDAGSYGENLLVEGQYVYAYGETREPVANNLPTTRHYVARAPVDGVLDASA
jgi:hypothetical protein